MRFRSSRRIRLFIILGLAGLSCFVYWDLTTNFCIEESSCVTTAYFFRDYILRSLHLAFPLTDVSASKDILLDRIIVVAHTNQEDVAWVKRRLSE